MAHDDPRARRPGTSGPDALAFGAFRRPPVEPARLDAPQPAAATGPREGETLAARIARDGPLPLSGAAPFAIELASALASVHAEGIVHLALAPENVFLTTRGEVQILDAPDPLRGTSRFLSPEQISGGPRIDHRSDVWSLGLTLYYALSGVVPTGAIPPLQDAAPALPAGICEVVDRMLSVDPAARCALQIVLQAFAAAVGLPPPAAPSAPTVDYAPPTDRVDAAAFAPTSRVTPIADPPHDERADHRLAAARAFALPLVVLPWGARSALIAVSESDATVVAELPFPSDGRPFFDGRTLVGAIGTEDPRGPRPKIAAFEVGRSLVPLPGSPFDLPNDDVDPCAFLVHGRALYLACRRRRGGELTYVRDLDTPETEWRALETPDRCKLPLKSVDALFIDRDRLIALDDVIFPKWLFVYDVRSPFAPRLLRHPELVCHGATERVLAASADAHWLAVLSCAGGGRSKAEVFLAFLDMNELAEHGHARASADSDRRGPWSDVVIHGGRAILAAGARGVGALPLAAAERQRALTLERGAPRAGTSPTLREPVLYALGDLRSGERVVRLAPIPGVPHSVVGAVAREESERLDVHRLEVFRVDL